MDLKQFNNIRTTLEILSEECAEVIKVKSKIIRFGGSERQIRKLSQEIGDVMAMVDILIANGIIDRAMIEEAKQKKFKKLLTFYKEPFKFIGD